MRLVTVWKVGVSVVRSRDVFGEGTVLAAIET